MYKFLRNTASIVFIVVVILTGISLLSDEGLKRTTHDNYIVWNDVLSGEINSDIIILGSSRAWVHVSPKILDTCLGSNSYNLGLDGHGIRLQKCIYDVYLKNNSKPKYVIQCLDLGTLGYQTELFNLEQLIPYLSNSTISSVSKYYEGFQWFDYYNPFTKYMYKDKALGIGLLDYLNIKNYSSKKYKGYYGKPNKWDHKFDVFKMKNPQGISYSLDKNNVKLFQELLSKSNSDEIKVILVYPPELKAVQGLISNRDSIIDVYHSIASKYNIPFLDYSDDSLCYEQDLFYNSTHLNKEGSELFSVRLATDLKGLNLINLDE